MSSSPIWYVSNVPAGLTKQVLEQQLGSFVYVHRQPDQPQAYPSKAPGRSEKSRSARSKAESPVTQSDVHRRLSEGVLDLPVPKPSTKGGSKRPAPMEPGGVIVAHHPPMAPGGSVVPPRPGKGWMRPPEPAHPPKAGPVAPASSKAGPVTPAASKAGPVAPAAAKTGLPVQSPPSKRRKTEGKAAGKIKGKKGAVPFYKRKGSLKDKGQGNIWNECNPDDLPDLPGSLVARFFPSGAQSTGEQSAGDLNAETETNVEAGNADIDTTPKAGEAAIGTETGAGNAEIETMSEAGNAEIETMSEAGNADIDTTPKAGHGGIEAKPDAGDDMTKAES